MALLTPLPQAAAMRLGRQFGLDVISIEPLQAGSVNSNFRLVTAEGAHYFARIYEEQNAEGAAAEARLLRELSAAGVPVAQALKPVSDEIPTHEQKPVALYPWVVGTEVRGRDLSPHHCERLGRELAKVHLASAQLSAIPEGRFGVEQLYERLRHIAEQAPRLAGPVDAIRTALERHTRAANHALPSGLTHGDLFRDNVLWENGEICALLDFESACRGVFIYDLMVCVLAWCYADEFVLPCVEALVSGYASLRPLSLAERQAAANQGSLACLRFATTRLTDFELRCEPGQKPVRDYRRFLQRMDKLNSGALNDVFMSVQTGEPS